MSNVRAKGLQNKLETTIAEKDFYQALQLYKTLYVRYVLKSRSSAEDLLVNGVGVMLEHNQV
jgi:hypothetical protein